MRKPNQAAVRALGLVLAAAVFSGSLGLAVSHAHAAPQDPDKCDYNPCNPPPNDPPTNDPQN